MSDTISTMKLTAQDRCDRCGAQAYVKATKDGAELFFCAHHGREHTPGLEAKGFMIYSETQRLEAPTVSVATT